MGHGPVILPPVEHISMPPVWVGPRHLSEPIKLALLTCPAPELGWREIFINGDIAVGPQSLTCTKRQMLAADGAAPHQNWPGCGPVWIMAAYP